MVSSLALLYWTEHAMLTLPTAELKARSNSLTGGKALPALGERIKRDGESEWISIPFWAYWRGLTAYSKHRANLLEETTPVSPAMTFQYCCCWQDSCISINNVGRFAKMTFSACKVKGQRSESNQQKQKATLTTSDGIYRAGEPARWLGYTSWHIPAL